MAKIGCYGCTKLEYIESMGTQYIDTEFSPNQDTRVVVDAKIEDNREINYWKSLFGAADATGNDWGSAELNRIVLMLHQNDDFVISYNNYVTHIDISDKKNRHIYDYGPNGFKVDNVLLVSFSAQSFQTINNLHIFRDNNFKFQDKRYIKMKLYYAKLYDNNNLIRDYIPVLDANNTPCLFDKVEKKCYYNQGTGEFLYG